jgi:hypothetical protein
MPEPAAALPESAPRPAPRPAAPEPSPEDTVISQSSLALSQAMAPDMMAEIGRRRKSAVLIVFDTPRDGVYEIADGQQANVRCYHTPDMSDAQLMQVIADVGALSQGRRNDKGGLVLNPPQRDLPFELKGDRLGMTLADFKERHARTVGGMKMPYTSESSPGQANPTLWSEPWHAAAGIVHGRVELPSENQSPTVAGVKTELFLYHFVDGKLFRMTALFDTEQFHLVREALAAKHGPPTFEMKDPLELAWENAESTIRLVRGTMRPKKWSSLVLVHRGLQELADSRAPQRGADV